MGKLKKAVDAHDAEQIRALLKNWTPPAIASAIKIMSDHEQGIVFRVLPRRTAATVFEFLDRAAQERLLQSLGTQQVADILNNMAADDRTELLEESPSAVTRKLLEVLDPRQLKIALSLLGYAKGTIGRLMTPNYVVVKEDWTVRQVLDHVRQHGQDSETLNVLYVVADDGVLIDDIRVREFLLAPLERIVADIMDHKFVALTATDAAQTAIDMFLSEDRKALPVTDTTGVLIGIVTIDDVLKIAERRATKEIQKIGGSEAFDQPYMTIGFWRMVKKRGGWLVVLFLGEMLTATAMGFFQARLKKRWCWRCSCR